MGKFYELIAKHKCLISEFIISGITYTQVYYIYVYLALLKYLHV